MQVDYVVSNHDGPNLLPNVLATYHYPPEKKPQFNIDGTIKMQAN